MRVQGHYITRRQSVAAIHRLRSAHVKRLQWRKRSRGMVYEWSDWVCPPPGTWRQLVVGIAAIMSIVIGLVLAAGVWILLIVLEDVFGAPAWSGVSMIIIIPLAIAGPLSFMMPRFYARSAPEAFMRAANTQGCFRCGYAAGRRTRPPGACPECRQETPVIAPHDRGLGFLEISWWRSRRPVSERSS